MRSMLGSLRLQVGRVCQPPVVGSNYWHNSVHNHNLMITKIHKPVSYWYQIAQHEPDATVHSHLRRNKWTGIDQQDRHHSSAFADTGRNRCVKRTKTENQRFYVKNSLLVAVLDAGKRSFDSPFGYSTVHFRQFEFEVELLAVLVGFDEQLRLNGFIVRIKFYLRGRTATVLLAYR